MELNSFTIGKSSLQKELQKVVGVINNKCMLPIHSNFLFEMEGNRLTITGNDTTVQIQTVILLENANNSFSFCLEKTILDVLKVLPEQPITVSFNSDILKATFQHSTGEYHFPLLQSTAYSKMKEVDKFTFDYPAKNLKSVLERSYKQMGNNDLHPIMSGIYVDIKPDEIVFVASDGHRLSRLSDKIRDIASNPFLIPRTAVSLLIKILGSSEDSGNVIISNDKTNVAVTVGNTTLTARQIEGNYPKYDTVIPRANTNRLVVESKTLTGIINRLLLVSSSSTHLIKISAGLDKTVFSAEDVDYNKSAKEETEWIANESIEIGVKGSFLTELLSSIPGNVVMSFSGPQTAILIEPENKEKDSEAVYLLMPLMLNV
ncbi:MAG: DNA polymerase III subunit beta [Tannerellaceae bacterium]|nr:DNA polymerase III subunit beta [Tannerellaceae bacterium]